ncbi:DUF2249 domain-containing protein [Massilia sp. MS-15]|uniref:DUF2249 domain-containing protein n=1 Tax=Massilia sp. MS-15 TaxID=2878200 RepID=UPI001CD61F3D|nr:DUF2249 domain-containing protein [Massilia sp. MS-15]MCA1246106.1 DUF2249 domain-containing protein [Massilia sp. MS-15]
MTSHPTPPVCLDVSGLLPPEPMEHILDALAALPAGAFLQVRIDREPFPLYRILERDGYGHRIAPRDDGRYDLMIWAVRCKEN